MEIDPYTIVMFFLVLKELVSALQPIPGPRRSILVSDDAPVVLVFSPHPDDECLLSLIAIFMLYQLHFRVINVAMTLGSKDSRKAERYKELKNACEALGFELIVPLEGLNLKSIKPKIRRNNRGAWDEAVEVIKDLLLVKRPHIILSPHPQDGKLDKEAKAENTHIGVNSLMIDSLRKAHNEDSSFRTITMETEYWRDLKYPNLIYEPSIEDVTDGLNALLYHAGENGRNIYPLSFICRLLDNVRRSEIVLGMGTPAPDFEFASIYRIRRWEEGGFRNILDGGRAVSYRDINSLEEIFGVEELHEVSLVSQSSST